MGEKVVVIVVVVVVGDFNVSDWGEMAVAVVDVDPKPPQGCDAGCRDASGWLVVMWLPLRHCCGCVDDGADKNTSVWRLSALSQKRVRMGFMWPQGQQPMRTKHMWWRRS